MPVRKAPERRVVKKARKKKPVRAAAGKPDRPVIDLLPELLDRALARRDDFIVTCETDPDTEKKTIHIISGRFVTPCMLRKLIGQVASQQDEGGILISRKWM